MTSKTFFLKLVLLIPGPQAPATAVIDIFLEPLVEDLLLLWEGVPAVDMSKPIGRRRFTLRAILLWWVHNFPVYSLFLDSRRKDIKAVLYAENTSMMITLAFYERWSTSVLVGSWMLATVSAMLQLLLMDDQREMELLYIKVGKKYTITEWRGKNIFMQVEWRTQRKI